MGDIRLLFTSQCCDSILLSAQTLYFASKQTQRKEERKRRKSLYKRSSSASSSSSGELSIARVFLLILDQSFACLLACMSTYWQSVIFVFSLIYNKCDLWFCYNNTRKRRRVESLIGIISIWIEVQLSKSIQQTFNQIQHHHETNSALFWALTYLFPIRKLKFLEIKMSWIGF